MVLGKRGFRGCPGYRPRLAVRVPGYGPYHVGTPGTEPSAAAAEEGRRISNQSRKRKSRRNLKVYE